MYVVGDLYNIAFSRLQSKHVLIRILASWYLGRRQTGYFGYARAKKKGNSLKKKKKKNEPNGIGLIRTDVLQFNKRLLTFLRSYNQHVHTILLVRVVAATLVES